VPEAALIRALEPTSGIETQQRRRGTDELRALCSGPGKLCQALAISREHDGLPLDRPPFRFEQRNRAPEIVTAPRIGITRATELSWRYLQAESPYVSRGRPRA
jgi:DNA-3-methyladenine glycosylase